MKRVLSRDVLVSLVVCSLAIVMCCCLSVQPVMGDELYGRIRGVVVDPAGAVLPDVQLKLTNADTGIIETATSGSDGSFIFVNLKPGNYNLAPPGAISELLK